MPEQKDSHNWFIASGFLLLLWPSNDGFVKLFVACFSFAMFVLGLITLMHEKLDGE